MHMVASVVHSIFVDYACDTGMQTLCCRLLSRVEKKEVLVAFGSDRLYRRHFESFGNLPYAFFHFCPSIFHGLKA